MRIWNPWTGEELEKWRAHNNSALCVAVSQDGLIVATAGEDLRIRVWKMPDHQELAAFVVESELKGLFLTDDGQTIVSNGNDQLRFWNVPHQTEFMQWKSIPKNAYLSQSPDRKILALQHGRNIQFLCGYEEPHPR